MSGEPMSAGALLEVRDLVVAYRLGGGLRLGRARELRAVDGVSLDVAAGAGVGLVGESGAGKTAVGRAILGLVPIAGGSIAFDGRDVTAYGRRVSLAFRRDVQVVFQDPRSSLNPRRTVRATLAQVVDRHRAGKRRGTDARVLELLDMVGLAEHHAERYPGELSGGQRQRVAIARALAPGPRLLVLDEAVSALDVSTQSQILNLLVDLRAQLGLGYLFISHDLAVVRQVAESVVVMRRGRVVEAGPSELLLTRPRQAYTQMLLASAPSPDPSGRDERRARRAALRAPAAEQAA